MHRPLLILVLFAAAVIALAVNLFQPSVAPAAGASASPSPEADAEPRDASVVSVSPEADGEVDAPDDSLMLRMVDEFGDDAGNLDWAGLERELLQRVADGDSEAMLLLGTYYVMPDSPILDWQRGVELLETAWRRGNVEAAETLSAAMLYRSMENGDEALQRAGLEWMEKAAGSGSLDAKRALANIHAGAVAELDLADRERGLYWVRDLGANVSAEQQVYLAQDVIRGRRFVQDFDTGIDMQIQAGRRGEPAALNDAAWILATCVGETPERLDEALALMEEEFRRYGRTAGTVDTLAAVYARMGNTSRAVSTQLEAIRLLEQEGVPADDPRFAAFYQRLSQYQAGSAASSDYPCPPAER